MHFYLILYGKSVLWWFTAVGWCVSWIYKHWTETHLCLEEDPAMMTFELKDIDVLFIETQISSIWDFTSVWGDRVPAVDEQLQTFRITDPRAKGSITHKTSSPENSHGSQENPHMDDHDTLFISALLKISFHIQLCDAVLQPEEPMLHISPSLTLYVQLLQGWRSFCSDTARGFFFS